ncbi:MAG: EamA family transporter [Patescibacteria group bacterium]
MWIIMALLSPAVFTVSNFIDKYLLSKSFKDYRALPIFTALVGFFFGSFFWILSGFPLLSFWDGFLVLVTGILTIWSLIIYFKALDHEETSIVIFLFQIIPILSLVLALIFLDERLNLKQSIGFILVIVSTMLIAAKKGKKKFRISRSFFLILLYDLIWAVIAILMKFIMHTVSFSHVVSYESFGIGAGGIMIYVMLPAVRYAFHKSLKNIRKKTIGIIIINEIVFIIAKSVNYYAFFLGPVALVSVIGNTQVFFGIAFGTVLTIFFPRIFRENISKEGLKIKLIGALLLFIGLFFLI